MLNFYKYEGAGNDFIMINNLNGDISLSPEKIKEMCDRHFGIGADGVILLEKSDKADCFMNYINSDGTLAEMCGNGVRSTAKFYLEQTNSNVQELNIDTRAGVKKIICHEDGTYSVDMGAPNFSSPDFPSQSINLENIDFNFVSMGNPHAVGIVNDLTLYDLHYLGPKIENDKNFPNKINMELVEKVSNNYFKVKVWERGCGATLACGTGACAVFSIINAQEPFLCTEVTLEFPGGKLFLSQNEQGHVILRGPATFIFKGEIK
jgi:diaminopimelate epimerase